MRVVIHKARLQDASNICTLVNSLSSDGTLLPRPLAEVCENIRDFTVAESVDGAFLGCGALHLYGPHLAEVRSMIVRPEAQGQGAGGRLLEALIDEAKEYDVGCVCLFTRIPDYFERFGFRQVRDRRALPDKIYHDCLKCPRLHCCDEVAMARGELPKFSILAPAISAGHLAQTDQIRSVWALNDATSPDAVK